MSGPPPPGGGFLSLPSVMLARVLGTVKPRHSKQPVSAFGLASAAGPSPHLRWPTVHSGRRLPFRRRGCFVKGCFDVKSIDSLSIVLKIWQKHTDPPHSVGLLCACTDRPCERHAAKKRDEVSPPQFVVLRLLNKKMSVARWRRREPLDHPQFSKGWARLFLGAS
jgi:hypothetical protein